MDLSSVIGAILGVVCFLVGIIVGRANMLIYVDISAVFITIGGSFGALMITNPLSRIMEIFTYLRIIFRAQRFQEQKIISQLVVFSEKARRDGLLALADDLD